MATAVEGINIALGTLGCTWVGKVLIAWINAKFGQKAKVEGSVETQVKPNPLNVVTEPKPEYVTKKEFEEHVAANAKEHENMVSGNTREHENLYSRLNRNDRETSEIKGILSAICEDIGLIKHKLFKTGAK